MPEWWQLDQSEPRGDLPPLLRPEAWTADEERHVRLASEVVLARFRQEDETGRYLACGLNPPTQDGAWLSIQPEYSYVTLFASGLVGGNYLSRSDRVTLEDLGFRVVWSAPLDETGKEIGSPDWPDYQWDVLLDTRNPQPGWELAIAAAVLATLRVYWPRYGEVEPIPPFDSQWSVYD